MKDPVMRWNGHMNSIARGRGCPALAEAIKKYGRDKFKFDILIICFDEDCFDYEVEYIKRYNSLAPNGYNILKGGICGGGFKGHRHRQETITKIKTKLQEIYNDKSIRAQSSQKLKHALKGLNISERMRASEKWNKAIQEGRVGNTIKFHLDETKKKISNSLKKYHQNHGSVDVHQKRLIMTKAVGKSVHQKSKEGYILATFPSISEASRQSGIGLSNIKECVRGKTTKAGGFIWEYTDSKSM